MDDDVTPLGPGSEDLSSQRIRRVIVALGVAAVVLTGAAIALAVIVLTRPVGSRDLRLSGIPANIGTSTADLMALSPVAHVAAPGFSLRDQNGHAVSLSQFRGRDVVLQFTDPHCTDICPIISQETADAYHDLGAAAQSAVFLAVNVNPFHTDLGATRGYTKAHGLSAVPTWYFVTGTPAALEKVWHDYGIYVSAPNATTDVIHSATMYFIDAHGIERYIATPQVDHTASGVAYYPATDLATWGHGIAGVVRALAS